MSLSALRFDTGPIPLAYIVLACPSCGATSLRLYHPDGREIAHVCALCRRVIKRVWLPNCEVVMQSDDRPWEASARDAAYQATQAKVPDMAEFIYSQVRNAQPPMSAPSPLPLLPKNTLQELYAAKLAATGAVKRARRSGGPSWLDRLLTRWTDAAARAR